LKTEGQGSFVLKIGPKFWQKYSKNFLTKLLHSIAKLWCQSPLEGSQTLMDIFAISVAKKLLDSLVWCIMYFIKY